MQSPIDIERAKYDDVWQRPEYRVKAHGLNLWQTRRDLFPANVASALDIGCGHGRLFDAWCTEGIDGHGVDFSAHAPDPEILTRHGERFHLQCLWEMELGRAFDLGVCADVMEHIPEEFVDATLGRIADHCEVAVFKIANFPSRSMGHDLHPTMRPGEWWWRRLLGVWSSVERLSHDTGREEYLFKCGG